MISTFTAFIDANVFFGARLRSLVIYVAQTKMFRVRWSNEIHDEWVRSVLTKRPDLSPSDLLRTRGRFRKQDQHLRPWWGRSCGCEDSTLFIGMGRTF